MIGPPIFPDMPIPTWDELLSDYTLHFFSVHAVWSSRTFNKDTPDSMKIYLLKTQILLTG